MQAMPTSVQMDVSLAPHTTFKIGGSADFFADASSVKDLIILTDWARENNVPLYVLGGGSNVVFADAGFRGLVVRPALCGIEYVDIDESVLVTASAGEQWDDFVAYTVRHGWWGIENLSGIPGTVGASPIQNIGAYGVEVGDFIVQVEALDTHTGEMHSFTSAMCEFAYRDSFFKRDHKKRFVITTVTYKLSKSPQPVTHYPDVQAVVAEVNILTQQDIRTAILQIRKRKFPNLAEVGTAGSFFKNPMVSRDAFHMLRSTFPDMPGHEVGDRVKLSAAWLIDHVAGARGARAGHVGTHDAQALVFVNYGGATASELKNFSAMIADKIKTKTNIVLEPEVQFVC